jgi:hypothetical protein
VDPVLALAEERLSVEPGGEARVDATVRNAGDLVEQYRLEVLGEAARWAQVVPRQISVLPGGAEEKTVSIVFRPPAPPATVAGEIPFGLRCVSMEAPDRCAVTEGDLVVGAVIGVQARLETVSPSGRWVGRYRIVFDNTGSVPVRLRLTATDSRRVLRFALAPGELTVQPGQSTSAYVSVKPRQPMLRGKMATHTFSVAYQTAEDGRGGELPGVFEQRPILSKGVIAAVLLLAVVGAVAVALALRNAGKPERPQPIAGPPPPIALTAATRLSDTSMQLLWQRSPYATGYVVQQTLPDGSVAASKEVTDRDQSALAWGELGPGRHCFRVIAVGPGGRSTPSGSICADLAKPAASTAPSATAPTGPGATPGPGSRTTAPPADGTDPVRGAYVIYATPTAIDDKAAQGVAEDLVARLQAAGIPARLIDSRDSKRVSDGRNGLWVVLVDGFPDLTAAIAECNAHRDVAPKCYAVAPA